MKLSDFYYDLPQELIAQKPLENRDMSRLMELDRASGTITEKVFRDVADHINEGDCLVLNDTRVIPVRLYGRRRTGGRVEIFLLNPWEDDLRALIRPSKKVREGEEIALDCGAKATVLGVSGPGRSVRFDRPVDEVLKEGHVPLPPYINRDDDDSDRYDYQTVYARREGATASPTAGLHFTEKLLGEIEAKGVKLVYVTLHTSYGTFAPVKEENIEDHEMHSEFYDIDERAASEVNDTRERGGRVIAVGTTSTRVLETASDREGKVAPSSGETNLFIYPGYEFKIINSIITNFHLPESTLLMLVSAFAGREFILEAYREAVKRKFRFFSYGDAMMII